MGRRNCLWLLIFTILSLGIPSGLLAETLAGTLPGTLAGTEDPSERFRIGMLRDMLIPMIGEDLDGSNMPPEANCAQSCHHHTPVNAVKMQGWFSAFLDTYKSCAMDFMYSSEESAKFTIQCLLQSPRSTGITRALYRSSSLRYVSESSKIPDAASTLQSMAMPPYEGPSDQADDSHGNLMSLAYLYQSVDQGVDIDALILADLRKILKNEVGGQGAQPPPLPYCQPLLQPELKSHIQDMQAVGWSVVNATDPNFQSFACKPLGEVSSCFNDEDYKDENGLSLFPLRIDFVNPPTKIQHPQVAIRLLRDIKTATTSYWMRTSADGRYIAIGGRGFERLKDTIQDQGPERISINASFDPGFFPDNSGFVFQDVMTYEGSDDSQIPIGEAGEGGEEREERGENNDPARFAICDQQILRDARILEKGEIKIDPRKLDPVKYPGPESDYCHLLSDMHLYQTIGKSLGDGSEVYLDQGSWIGDPGIPSIEIPVWGFSSESSQFRLSYLSYTDRVPDRSIVTVRAPFEGDHTLSPSTRLSIGRLATHDEKAPTDDGYVIRLNPLTAPQDPSEPYSNSTSAAPVVGRMCLAGTKASLSYDERFVVTHRYINRYDYKEYGFASESDPEFKKLRKTSSDIWIGDMLTGQTLRLTQSGIDKKALYPHFRSDGWLYFMTVTTTPVGPNTSYYTSNIALEMARANPL